MRSRAATNFLRITLAGALLASGVAMARAALPTTQPTTRPFIAEPVRTAASSELIKARPTTMRVIDPDAIRVGIYNGTGGRPLGRGEGNLARCLEPSGKFDFRLVTAEQIRSGVLSEVDVLVQAGCGNGGGQAKALEAGGRDAIRAFVARGGGYVGICAGAYLATAEYPWSLHIVNAKLVDRAHWARGKGKVRLGFSDSGRALLNAGEVSPPMYFVQGPLFAPGDVAGLPAYEVLARFEDEVAENGAPAGQMIGATAAVSATYDRGRVICLSPHAESTDGYGGVLRRAVSWAAGRVVD